MTEIEHKWSCVIVHIENGGMHVTWCATQRQGERDEFPAGVPLSEVRKSLACKVQSETIEHLCAVWDAVRMHLEMHGGQAFVHADVVDVSRPRAGRLVIPAARSAVV